MVEEPELQNQRREEELEPAQEPPDQGREQDEAEQQKRRRRRKRLGRRSKTQKPQIASYEERMKTSKEDYRRSSSSK
jgi:hypothetical protein